MVVTFGREQKVVAIIHYNTPELTEAAILSLRKHGGQDYKVVVFDNSTERPFNRRQRHVIVVDNTKGQIIDFDKELAKFPHRDASIGCGQGCEYGSAKHMMTVQKLWEMLPEGFVLMESDVLLKKSIDHLWQDEYATVGHNQMQQPHNPHHIGRVCPMLCYMNVPLLQKYGAKYFDEKRTYGLLEGGRENRNNWYDTGAVLFEDIVNTKPALIGKHVDIRELVEHYASASWRRNDVAAHLQWLEQHKNLWQMPEAPKKVAICAIGRMENRYAVEWVDHYKALGVDKIFIYDNNRPEDGETFHDVLQAYINDGLVQIFDWDGLQKPAYEDCYRKFNEEYAWMGFFDFDEQLVIEDHQDIHQWLKQYDENDAVVINWRTMTDNGLTQYQDIPLKERFTKAAPKELSQNRHVKCFVHTGIQGISFNDPHCPNAPHLCVVNVLGEWVEQVPIQPEVLHQVAYINHYDTKTADEWVNIKMKRGSCCGEVFTANKRLHSADYFFSINKRTKEKEIILGLRKPDDGNTLHRIIGKFVNL